jgi:hypothetical protein
MWYFSFIPGGFGYVRPPSIRSRADYGGHAALKEAEGGCRGKSLLNLIQVLLALYFPFALDPAGPAIPKPFARRSALAKVARQRQKQNRWRKFSKNFPVRLSKFPRSVLPEIPTICQEKSKT